MSQEADKEGVEELGYHPDMIEAQPDEEQVFCFLNNERVCGPDCVSYETFIKKANKELRGPAKHCVLLTSIERVGRHLPIIAKIMSDGLTATRRQAADQQREASAPKVDPAPGPFASSPFPVGGKKP